MSTTSTSAVVESIPKAKAKSKAKAKPAIRRRPAVDIVPSIPVEFRAVHVSDHVAHLTVMSVDDDDTSAVAERDEAYLLTITTSMLGDRPWFGTPLQACKNIGDILEWCSALDDVAPPVRRVPWLRQLRMQARRWRQDYFDEAWKRF